MMWKIKHKYIIIINWSHHII